VLVFNIDNGNLNSSFNPTRVFRHGIATVSVPAGNYFAIAGFITAKPNGIPQDVTDARLDMLPQFAVTKNTTVHTSAKAATSQVTMVTPRPAKAESSDFGVWRTPASGPASSAWVSALGAAVWVNPVRHKPSVGSLTGYAAQQLASPAGPATPYQYELSYADPPGIIPPQTYHVRQASLAMVTGVFYQDVPSGGQWLMPGTAVNVFPPSAGYINPYPHNLSLPGRQIRYIGGNVPATQWGGYYNATDENGTKIADGSVPIAPGPSDAFTTQATLSPEPTTVRFTLDMKQTGPDFPLSTASTTVWTWRSSHKSGSKLPPGWYCDDGTLSDHCRAEPMMTLLYHVHAMALNGTTPAGQQVMDVTAGHIQPAAASAITGATVQYSTDDGKTWHKAQVTRQGPGRYQAVYTAPAGAYVTLRTTATDAAGGSITETITRGYQITP
jgi:hypothetical protein